MAVKNISNASEVISNLEFVADWIEDKSPKEKASLNGQTFAVKSISVAESGKGYTLITPAFMVFFWKKSPEGSSIQKWIEESEGFLPVIVIDLSRKSKCLLAEDDEVTVYFDQLAKGGRRYKVIDDPLSNYSKQTEPPSEPKEEETTTVPAPQPVKNKK